MVAWYKQQWAEEDKEAARISKLVQKRKDYLATPGKLEGDVANLAEYFSPSHKKVKSQGYTKAETLRRREEGGPLEGFQRDTASVYRMYLDEKENLDISNKQLLAQAGQLAMTEGGYLEALQRNKLKADTSVGRLFGVLGPDENVKKPPGYDEWRADEEVKQDLRTKSEWIHPAESAAMGAGGYVAWEMAKRVFKKRALSAAVTALIPLPGARPVALAKIGMAAALAIPEFFAFDVGKNIVAHSKWAKARQEEGKLDRADVAEFGLGILAAGGAGSLARVASKKLKGKFTKAVDEKLRHEAQFPYGLETANRAPEPGVAKPGAWDTFRKDFAFPGSTPERTNYAAWEDFRNKSAAHVLSEDKANVAAGKFAEQLRRDFKVSDYDMLEATLAERRIGLGKVPVSQKYVKPEEYPIVPYKPLPKLLEDNPWIFKPQTDTWVNGKWNRMSEAEQTVAIQLANKNGTRLREEIFKSVRTQEVEKAAPKVVKERAAIKKRKTTATPKVKKALEKTNKTIEEAVATTEAEASSTLETPMMDILKKAKGEEISNKAAITKSIDTMLDALSKPGASASKAKKDKATQAVRKIVGNSDDASLAMRDLETTVAEASEAGGTAKPTGTGIFRDWSRKWGGKISLSAVGLALAGALPAGYVEASDESNAALQVQMLSEETELSSANIDALTSQGEDITKVDGTLSDTFKNFGEAALEVGTTVLKELSETFTGRSAEAAVPNIVVPAIKAAASKSKGALDKMLTDMFNAGVVHTTMPEGAKSVEHIMESLHTAPDIMKQVGSMKEALTGKKTPFIGWLMSPFGQAQVLYKSYSEKVGGKLQTYFMSPMPEYASGQSKRIWMTRDHMTATSNILKDVGLPKKRTKAIMDAMSPLAKKYREDEIAYSAAKMAEEHLSKKLTNIAKALTKKKKGGALAKVRKAQAEVLEGVENTKKALIDLTPKHEQFIKDWKVATMDLAEKEPATRIALMLEDAHIHEGLTGLPKLLTEQERQAVVHLKDMMSRYAERYKAIGEEVITDRAYAHHAWHPEWTKAAAEKRLLSYGIKSDVVPYSKLFHRSKFSKQMSPDINYIMQKYIFDAERRLQRLEFWDKKKIFSEESWYTHYQWVKNYGSKELKSFWDNLNRGFTPPAGTAANQWANRYSAIEVLRLIAFSPSTAFKHYFKNVGTASSLGVGTFLSHVPESFVQGSRILAHDVATVVAPKLGLKAPNQLKRLEDQVTKSFTGTAKGLNVFAGLDLEPSIRNVEGFWPAFDRQLAEVNKAGGSLIGMVEAVDRTHTLRASFDIAAKKGLTVKQAMYSYWSNVLDFNFLSGELNPTWVKNPITRALFLFQNTAYKIFERRALTAIHSGRDIIGAGKAFKGIAVENLKGGGKKLHPKEALKALHDVGRWMVGREKDLKKNLILDALTSTKDIGGVPYIQRAMREAVMSGIILGGGSAIGLNLFPQVMHVPFVAHGASEPTLAANPLVHALFRTTMGHEQGGRDIEDEDFWFSEFLQEWLRGSGYFNMTANKTLRTIKGDIPTMYEADTGNLFPDGLLYLFSVPRKKEAIQ